MPAKLKKLIAELDLDAIGVLHAVEYPVDGKPGIYVIDGQHRLRALMDHGFGEWLVEVKIHLDATDDARASALFLKLNDRSPVGPFDKFMNEIRAGLPDALGVVAATKKQGLTISRHVADGAIACVSALKRVYLLDGGSTLSLTLGALTTAWGRTSEAVEGKLVEGVGLLFSRYNGSIDQAALVKKLAKYRGGAPALLGDAKGLMSFRKSTLSRCVAERVVETYNVGRRTGRLDPL